jgi:hypothetical protein
MKNPKKILRMKKMLKKIQLTNKMDNQLKMKLQQQVKMMLVKRLLEKILF